MMIPPPGTLTLGKAHASVAPGSDLANEINAALPTAYSRLAAAAAAGGRAGSE